MISIKLAPPNSLVLVKDPGKAEIPDSMSGLLVAATSSCIAVGCRSEADGETDFTLGLVTEVNPGYSPAFNGKLKTPNQKIVLETVLGQTILEHPVLGRETPVKVWVNDPNEPDIVIVGIGEGV